MDRVIQISRAEYRYKIAIVPIEEVTDTNLFANKILKTFAAEFKVLSVERKGDKIIIDHIIGTGRELINPIFLYKNELSVFGNVVSVKCLLKKVIKSSNYLDYLAHKRHNGEEPISIDEFQARIDKGEYWEDI